MVSYKMVTFYKIKKKLPLSEVMKNTTKNPKETVAFGAYIFCMRHQRVKKSKYKYAENVLGEVMEHTTTNGP